MNRDLNVPRRQEVGRLVRAGVGPRELTKFALLRRALRRGRHAPPPRIALHACASRDTITESRRGFQLCSDFSA